MIVNYYLSERNERKIKTMNNRPKILPPKFPIVAHNVESAAFTLLLNHKL